MAFAHAGNEYRVLQHQLARIFDVSSDTSRMLIREELFAVFQQRTRDSGSVETCFHNPEYAVAVDVCCLLNASVEESRWCKARVLKGCAGMNKGSPSGQ
jgi:hypothetical protein